MEDHWMWRRETPFSKRPVNLAYTFPRYVIWIISPLMEDVGSVWWRSAIMGVRTFIDTSCTHEVREGMVIQTQSPRIIRARKMLAELLVTSAPNVKMAQDIAARMGLLKVRFPMEDNRCILCGLCIRMCYEQMDGKALGFVGRGMGRKVSMPFEVRPETCRLCRGCDYVCPGMIIPCQGVNRTWRTLWEMRSY